MPRFFHDDDLCGACGRALDEFGECPEASDGYCEPDDRADEIRDLKEDR